MIGMLVGYRLSRHERTKGLRLAWIKTVLLAFVASLLVITAEPAAAQNTAFKKALAQAAAKDKTIQAFYKARDYKPIWTGSSDRRRRVAFLDALRKAPAHGLPRGRYDAAPLKKQFAAEITACR